jgi:hypothetical protein
VGGGFIVVCRCETTTHNNPHNHTHPTHNEIYLCNTTYCYSTYQQEMITSRSRQLLMMGTWLPETCYATSRREIKNTKVTSSWFFLSTLSKINCCAYLRYSEINTVFCIFHSVHYNSVFVIPTNKCTVSCTSLTHADTAPFYCVTILSAAHIQSTKKNYHNFLYQCTRTKCC